MELRRRLHGVLPGHGVGHKQDFHWVQLGFELLQFYHQIFVNV